MQKVKMIHGLNLRAKEKTVVLAMSVIPQIENMQIVSIKHGYYANGIFNCKSGIVSDFKVMLGETTRRQLSKSEVTLYYNKILELLATMQKKGRVTDQGFINDDFPSDTNFS